MGNKFIFVMKKLDLTSVGGPMGSERITTILTRHCLDIDKAKSLAKYDHEISGGKEPIKWSKSGNCWSSQDLLSHQYEINKVQLYG